MNQNLSLKKRTRHAGLIGLVVLLFFFYFFTQFSTHAIVGTDGHFHIRYSQLMLERGLPERLPELKFTTWGQSYRDYHLLFHILYIPFSLFDDIRLGAKAAATTFAFLAGLSFLLIIRSLKVRQTWLWLILFTAGSADFLYRLQMPRVQAMSLIILLWVIWSFLRQKNKILFILGILNVWLYDSFILLFLVAALWIISEKLTCNEWKFKPALFLFLGMFAGMVINPYFPHNFASYWMSIARNFAPQGSIPLPSEWHPDTAWEIMRDNAVFVISAFCLGVLSLLYPRLDSKKTDQKSEHLFLFLASCLTLAMLFKSRRFIEYASPVVLLYLVVVHRDIMERIPLMWRRVLTTALVVSASVCAVIYTTSFYMSARTDKMYTCYEHAGQWLAQNTQKEDVVFPSDWDDFPMLYMQAPYVQYVVGLDPLFLKLYDNNLYELYKNITLGKKEGPYSALIRNKFSSRLIFTDTKHDKFIGVIEHEPTVKRVFEESACRIYEIASVP